MNLVKKLAFAPIFLVAFTLLIYQSTLLLKSYDFIFSLALNTFIELIVVSALIMVSSLSFAIFVSLAADWKLILPVGILGSLIPLLFFDISLAIILTVGILVSLLLTYLSLENTLKSYLTFQPEALFGPPIRHLSGLLILSFCLVYFLSTNKIVAQAGFQIPDSLIETALKFSTQSQSGQSETSTSKLSIPTEQIELLKKNPDLLKQAGLDPKDSINNLLKQTVKDQLQNFIKPYLGFIPAFLAVLLFLTLQSLTSLINLLIYPLLWIIFYILEKTGFIKFETEMRPVKKMVL